MRGLAPIMHGPRDAKLVAVTFDDGPGRLTEAVLEVLARHGARATFNVLGERIAGREEMLLRTMAQGHEVGSHAFRHEPLEGHPIDAYHQLRRTNAAIGAASGSAPRVFRPPYGRTSPGVVLAARLNGLSTVGWDVDPHDYDTPGADVILRRMIRRVKPGSIVLLHDDRRALVQTVEALDPALGELRDRGYRFVTVSELLGLAPRGAGRGVRTGKPRGGVPLQTDPDS